MKKSLLFLFVLIICWSISNGQQIRYVIQLKDKANSAYRLDEPEKYLSTRAIQRRINRQIKIDSTDLPISSIYLDSISNVPNVVLLNQSKWLNQVLISSSDPLAISRINAFSFVKSLSPVAERIKKTTRDSIRIGNDMQESFLRKEIITSESQDNSLHSSTGVYGNTLDYGNTYAQIHIHEGEYLHNMGFKGQGIVIAIIDAGFNSYLSNPAFDSLRLNHQVLGTFDFVNGKTSVNEEDIHGAYCLSTMAAHVPGKITGTATGASFWLLKTEDTRSEYPVEEQNWAVAAAFADSAGADMISTSLGYAYFDDPSFDHHYTERDGHTSIISVAANIAVSKGMIVTASAGNTGNATDESKFIDCPADADSVLTIGAIDAKGQIASFSSWGPNSAGMIKPELVSVGLGTVVASSDGTPILGNGTSFSNPNLAGLIACLWQAFPEFNGRDILRAVIKSGDRFTHPDERYGYGIPNFRFAYQDLLDQRTIRQYLLLPGRPWISAYPVPFANSLSVVFNPSHTGQAIIVLVDAGGKTIETRKVPTYANEFTILHFEKTDRLAKGVYYIRYDDGHQQKTIKTVKL